ncbi:MAG: hypothetical protein ABL984_03175 [Pyrinomonadaceae bacterium]
MFEKPKCPKCNRELTGAIETTTTNDGIYSFIVQKETSDCNWVNCQGCKQVMCKTCYQMRPRYCCNEGRIVDRERARATLVDSLNGNTKS